jgi:hypothetical protein
MVELATRGFNPKRHSLIGGNRHFNPNRHSLNRGIESRASLGRL